MDYIQRNCEAIIREHLEYFPVLCITGPRQSGKSTLLKKCLSGEYEYVTMDDPQTVDFFEADPVQFMNRYSNRVIFDEVQKVPQLFHYLKIAVDNDRDNYGKFILTGSSQLTLSTGISESLAGRVGMVKLFPMGFTEVPLEQRDEVRYRGCYPELVSRNFRGAKAWYASYLDTYITRDVREIKKIGDLRNFKRLLYLMASLIGQPLNVSALSAKIGIAQNTVREWISLLEASYIIFLLPPYYQNFGKRMTKSPRIYFYDTGLVCHILGLYKSETVEKSSLKGEIFENYFIAEVLKGLAHFGRDEQLYYYRTNHGIEIDLILDSVLDQEFIEIKSGMTYKSAMLDNIRTIVPDGRKALVYTGETITDQHGFRIINYKDYLEKFAEESRAMLDEE